MRRAALSPKPFLSRALPLASSPSLPPFHEDLLRFKLPHSVQDVSGQTPTGYAPPRGGTEDLPFRVIRTRSGNLPVYTAYKNGRTKKVTILRKFLGDSKVPTFFIHFTESPPPPPTPTPLCAPITTTATIRVEAHWFLLLPFFFLFVCVRYFVRRCGACLASTQGCRSKNEQDRSRSRATVYGSLRCG